MKIPFFPGCVLKTTANNYEVSALASSKVLGIELFELPRWNCCGTAFSLTTDDLMHHLAAIRDLIRVQELNEDRLVTLCTCCFSTLKRANLLVKRDSEKLEKINAALDREEEYTGGVNVVHYLEILREIGYDKIAEKVVHPLKGLKVTPYYGCLLLKPKEVGIDNPYRPVILKELLEALGAEVVDSPYEIKCCGSYLTVNNKYKVAEMTYDRLTFAQRMGAEAIALTCPLCAFNLDNRQKEVMELKNNFKTMPVFYFTQLMAVAFGIDERFSAFELNYVDPRPLLKVKKLLVG